MSTELVDALQAALNVGHTFSELETSVLDRADTDDRIAAAWLYAWAYDAIRPRRGDLAARLRTVSDQPSLPRDARDPRRRQRLLRHGFSCAAPSRDWHDRDGSHASIQRRSPSAPTAHQSPTAREGARARVVLVGSN